MSANPSEFFSGYTGMTHGAHAPAGYATERRKRARIRVHWPVLLFRGQAADAIASATQDLSSSGFYCLTSVPLVPGEVLTCALKVPIHDPSGKHLDRTLECKVRIVRVETQGVSDSFGVACQIEDYHFADLLPRLPIGERQAPDHVASDGPTASPVP